MAGNSRSGRKTNYERVINGNLLDICTEWLVANFSTFDKDTKIKVALEIAKKGIIQKVEVEAKHEVTVKHEDVEERVNCLSLN